MPVCRLIGKKWKSTDKIVQSVDVNKPFKVVMPAISKKLEIGSMRHYTAYIANADKIPIKMIDPEVPMGQYDIAQGTFIYVAANDALPTLPDAPAEETPAAEPAAAAAEPEAPPAPSAPKGVPPPPPSKGVPPPPPPKGAPPPPPPKKSAPPPPTEDAVPDNEAAAPEAPSAPKGVPPPPPSKGVPPPPPPKGAPPPPPPKKSAPPPPPPKKSAPTPPTDSVDDEAAAAQKAADEAAAAQKAADEAAAAQKAADEAAAAQKAADEAAAAQKAADEAAAAQKAADEAAAAQKAADEAAAAQKDADEAAAAQKAAAQKAEAERQDAEEKAAFERREAERKAADEAAQKAREEADKKAAEDAKLAKAEAERKAAEEKAAFERREAEIAAAAAAEDQKRRDDEARRKEEERQAQERREAEETAAAQKRAAEVAAVKAQADEAIARTQAVAAAASGSVPPPPPTVQSPIASQPPAPLPRKEIPAAPITTSEHLRSLGLPDAAVAVLNDAITSVVRGRPSDVKAFLFEQFGGKAAVAAAVEERATSLPPAAPVSPTNNIRSPSKPGTLDALLEELRGVVEVDRPLDTQRYVCEYLYRKVSPNGPGPFASDASNDNSYVTAPRTQSPPQQQGGASYMSPRDQLRNGATPDAHKDLTRYERLTDSAQYMPNNAPVDRSTGTFVVGGPGGKAQNSTSSPYRHKPWPNTGAPYAAPSPTYLASMVSEIVRREVDALSPRRQLQQRQDEVRQLEEEVTEARRVAGLGEERKHSLSKELAEAEDVEQIRTTMKHMMERERSEKERLLKELDVLRHTTQHRQASSSQERPRHSPVQGESRRIAEAASRIEHDERQRLSDLEARNAHLDELIARYRNPTPGYTSSSSQPRATSRPAGGVSPSRAGSGSPYGGGGASRAQDIQRKRMELLELERQRELLQSQQRLGHQRRSTSRGLPASPAPNVPDHFTPVRGERVNSTATSNSRWRSANAGKF